MSRDVAPDNPSLPQSERALQKKIDKDQIDLSLSRSQFQAAYLATLLNRNINCLFQEKVACSIKDLQPTGTENSQTLDNFNRRKSEGKIELSATQNGSAFRRVQPKNRDNEMNEIAPLVQEHLLGPHFNRLNDLKEQELKELTRHHPSDSSVPQSPISFPTESPTPGENASPVPNSSNKTDDEKLKNQALSPLKLDEAVSRKQSTRSPLPIKKRRLHQSQSFIPSSPSKPLDVLTRLPVSDSKTTTPSQSPVPSSSSSIKPKSERPKKNLEHDNLVAGSSGTFCPSPLTPHPHRNEDILTELELAKTLLCFKRSVTPATVEADSFLSGSSSSSAAASTSESEISVSNSRKSSSLKRETKGRLRRTASSLSGFDENELQQLAPFMGLSGSEKSDSESSSDEYATKARLANEPKKKYGSRKRSKREPAPKPKRAAKKQVDYQEDESVKMEPEIKEENLPAQKVDSSKNQIDQKVQAKTPSRPKKSLDNVLMDLKTAQENDEALRKFYEADVAVFEPSSETEKPKSSKQTPPKSKSNAPVKKSRKPSKPQKLEATFAPEKKKNEETTSKGGQKEGKKEKSTDDENNWVPSEETIVDKNSSAGENYLIGETDESWNSVTCFCGLPFAGRPMIECDNCSLWVHMTCGKVRKNYVPAKYICPLCKPLKRNSNSSSKNTRKRR
ncbi:Oidioi.mRNA.OKI2018_I69.chr1.g1749.t1.cds [Oikopleura dioica]|uniref:Oidioi.mRNA.OKI2018_I69.chr1.g1749.t1.cds n=1 Tax=Oikopleura dioica TaxID=34765 RepID=A0ABN7SSP5_OIKDI|nr:Oidioi.mRNA.OKI2018_I69.chr1.g1749.t1.cds [Oikopleura dioica]